MNPYRHADKALKTLKGEMEAEFQNFSTTVGFDELNFLDLKKSVEGLYNRIDKAVRREFRKVARQVYRDAEDEVTLPHGKFETGLFLVALLKRFDPVTQYVYLNEWTRKRDRLVESLMASGGNQQMREALQRALNLMSDQVRQYADNLTKRDTMLLWQLGLRKSGGLRSMTKRPAEPAGNGTGRCTVSTKSRKSTVIADATLWRFDDFRRAMPV